ncbi:MAG TPA: multiheme c-type cytochrome [Mucilaginibacter sp.]|nr:multiheme c-type cytochrome [Mucilaginibacter sp.]
MLKNKLFRYGIFFIPLIFVFSQCINLKKKEDPRGSEYAGSATCIKCHKDVYDSYLHTAHFIASSPADSNSILGSFKSGSNQFIFSHHIKVAMEKRKSGYYQVTYADGKPTQAERFGVTFGGVKGQSFAYWYANELFQLPISYVTKAHTWINSPGYQSSEPDYERQITSRCLGCHMSYAQSEPGKLPIFSLHPEGFDRNSIIYNIDCERCHGPAAEHVKFQTENPEVKEAKYIRTYQSLTREQKISMCAVCHSGANNIMLKPTFGFKPGDTLSNYMKVVPSNLSANYENIDVHGDQRGMLATSRCYLMSNMDCATCHDTHRNERGDSLLYAQRCLNCHNAETAHQGKLSTQLSAAMIKSNCIACHMPAHPSKLIIAGQSGAMIHTHHIAIYSAETQKVLTYLKIKNTYTAKVH